MVLLVCVQLFQLNQQAAVARDALDTSSCVANKRPAIDAFLLKIHPSRLDLGGGLPYLKCLLPFLVSWSVSIVVVVVVAVAVVTVTVTVVVVVVVAAAVGDADEVNKMQKTYKYTVQYGVLITLS